MSIPQVRLVTNPPGIEFVGDGVVVREWQFEAEREVSEVDGRQVVGDVRANVKTGHYTGPVELIK